MSDGSPSLGCVARGRPAPLSSLKPAPPTDALGRPLLLHLSPCYSHCRAQLSAVDTKRGLCPSFSGMPAASLQRDADRRGPSRLDTPPHRDPTVSFLSIHHASSCLYLAMRRLPANIYLLCTGRRSGPALGNTPASRPRCLYQARPRHASPLRRLQTSICAAQHGLLSFHAPAARDPKTGCVVARPA
jgi:hypothetical protein